MGELLRIGFSRSWPVVYLTRGNDERAQYAFIRHLRSFGHQAEADGRRRFVVTRLEGVRLSFDVIAPVAIDLDQTGEPMWIANGSHWFGSYAVRAKTARGAIAKLAARVTSLGFDESAAAKLDFLGREKLVVKWEGQRIYFDIFATQLV